MWRIEHDANEHLLTLQLKEHVGIIEMRGLARAHARALEATGGDSFHVLLDLRGLYPLDVDAAELLTDMKRVAASLPGYRSRAVLVDSPTIAMQQRNTTLEDGGDDSELITLDAAAATRFVSSG